MASAHSFSSIPILDLSLADSPSTRPGLLKQLHHALVSVGFLYVSNHGVPEDVVKDLVNILPVLFGLPEDSKGEMALSNSPHFLGHSSAGTETTAGRADRREQVEFATELEARYKEGNGMPLYERLRGPNQWPSDLPSLRPIVEAYIRELSFLGERFLQLVAEALSLQRDALLPFLSEQHRLKLVHYPANEDVLHGGSVSPQQGVGPHKDSSGWWTFLLQASPPHIKGLQALNRDGEWIEVPVIPGTFVVNIGQAFEVVTNGVCKATTHRVVMSEGTEERFSVPFFQGVRWDLTKEEAVGTLKSHFEDTPRDSEDEQESTEAKDIDSAFLRGKYDTWGESQLRTKIRSHRDVGKRFYRDVYEKYINDD